MKLELKTGWRQKISVPGKAVHFDTNGSALTTTGIGFLDKLKFRVVARATASGVLFGGRKCFKHEMEIYPDGFCVKGYCERELAAIGSWAEYGLEVDIPRGHIIWYHNGEPYEFPLPEEFQGTTVWIDGYFINTDITYAHICPPALEASIDLIIVESGNRLVDVFNIEEGAGDLIYSAVSYRYLRLYGNYTWTDGKPLPPQLYQKFEIKEV